MLSGARGGGLAPATSASGRREKPARDVAARDRSKLNNDGGEGNSGDDGGSDDDDVGSDTLPKRDLGGRSSRLFDAKSGRTFQGRRGPFI